MRRTGGGFDVVPELSLLEQRLVAMGGDSFATGNRGLAVDPFPQSDSNPSILVDLPSTSQIAAVEVVASEIQESDQVPPCPVEAELRVEHGEQQGETSSVLPSGRHFYI
ncbi:uncharacterized protein LOC113238865 [Hyposmocoma kahamanoa]|uniref:uncharacterized protein LOC113238865 n=1 Tax=Hyposmocoma kahamanoa TaxID=1477025 RepID=UPI000E6DA011|nr:uncharacterized protein LOC113238865 [Hyposmocoma kahamanoa]